jgi:hypothetical protein
MLSLLMVLLAGANFSLACTLPFGHGYLIALFTSALCLTLAKVI